MGRLEAEEKIAYCETSTDMKKKEVIGYVLMSFMLLEIVFLIAQNRQLKKQIETVGSRQAADTLAVGQRASSIDFQALDGSSQSIEFKDPSKKYLLYIFSTTCPYCEKNMTNWNAIYSSVHASNLTILALSIRDLETTRKYYDQKRPLYPVAVPSEKFEDEYKVHVIPKTLLIDQSGIVEKSWSGLLDSIHVAEVMKSCTSSSL
jgi:peroxiredoxin